MTPDLKENVVCRPTGNALTEAVDALKVARAKMRLAQGDALGWHLETLLSDIEDEISGQLGRIHDAIADDDADREDTEALRQMWYPSHRGG